MLPKPCGYCIFAIVKYRNSLYLLSLLPAIFCVFGNLTGGYWGFTNYMFVFFILALIEHISGSNSSNRFSDASTLPEAILVFHVLANILTLGTLAYGIHSGIISGWFFIVLASFSTGAHTATSAVVISHELIHKNSKWQRGLGKFLLAISGNIYFYIHHLRIHHKDVGTTKDAATARFNENLYQFAMRSVSGQLKQAWQSESQMLKRKEKSIYSLHNYMIRAILVQIAIVIAVYTTLSWPGLLAWGINVYLAALLLEYVNYIEHYGLSRTTQEKVIHTHSWNSDKYISRFILIDLSRHADHHHLANKPFYSLDSHAESPVLPGGYASLVIPALIPALWRKKVHPVLSKWKIDNGLQG